jgi:hypothetical protein
MKKNIFLLLLLILQVFIASNIVSYRQEELKLRPTRWMSDYPISSTGPLKGYLMGLWWIEIFKHTLNFEYERIDDIAQRISILNPFSPKVWYDLAFNMAINISVEMRYEEDKHFEWFVKGLDHLERGKDFNPKSALIRFEQGLIVYTKLRYYPELSNRFIKHYKMEPMEYIINKMNEAASIGKLDYKQEMTRAQMHYLADKVYESTEIFNKLIEDYPNKRDYTLAIMQDLKADDGK